MIYEAFDEGWSLTVEEIRSATQENGRRLYRI